MERSSILYTAVACALYISATTAAVAQSYSLPINNLIERLGKPRTPTFRPQIVGGMPVLDRTRHPFVVALYLKQHPRTGEVLVPAKGQFCGGTLIDPRWVLTAAHCVDGGTRASMIGVFAGQPDLRQNDQGTVFAKVEQIIVHEKWTGVKQNQVPKNDIALLKLETNLSLATIELSKNTLEGRDPIWFLTMGWGKVHESGPSSHILKEVPVPFVPNAICNARDSYSGRILDGMFCAGAAEKDSCNGDSGGPLIRQAQYSASIRELVGIVSWGDGCGRAKFPGVYTLVAYFRPWINSKLGR